MSVLKNSLRQKFAQIPNELITDTRISNGAFRVAAYLYSRPDNWNVNNKDVQNSLGINDRGTLAKYWNELIDNGWMSREVKPHNESGYFSGYDYTLLMSSTVAGETLHGDDEPCREKPAAVKTRSGKNPTLSNKEFLSNTDSLNNTEINTSPNGGLFFSLDEIEDLEAQLNDQPSEAPQAPPVAAAAQETKPVKAKPQKLDALSLEMFNGFDRPDAAMQAWEIWEDYKRTEKGQRYKTTATRALAIKELHGFSNGNSDKALAIINQSRTKTWTGLFQLAVNNSQPQFQAAKSHNPRIIDQSKYD